MSTRAIHAAIFIALTAFPRPVLGGQGAANDLEELNESAMKAAVARIAPAIVQIETSGGSDILGSGMNVLRRGTAPTTGVIVSSDGYIISSAFNFANKPSAIFIAIVGQKERLVARTIATDQTRMLTLLKVDAKDLPVPAAVPKKTIRVGQWSLALGRSILGLDAPPSVSVGIVSALGRIWGKAIQTDAKVSPVNYGGPLIDLAGNVLGVLVPASPRGQDETAGVEWYDGGIGFAIPFEDVLAAVPKLKLGKDLRKGLLGITMRSADIYSVEPVIATVAPDSGAALAGFKPGDVITEINGVKIVRQAQVMHLLGDKYEGDTVQVRIRRDKQDLNVAAIRLTGSQTVHVHSFLGVLPVRDDPEIGEEIRFVYPGSPAEQAGLKIGDRIMRIGLVGQPLIAFSGRDALTTLLDGIPPGSEVQVEVKRKGTDKNETVRATLAKLPENVPDILPENSTARKALTPRKALPSQPRAPGTPAARGDGKKADAKKAEPKKDEPKPKDAKKKETGLLKRTTAARDHQYWLYVPDNYDANVSHALVIWLHSSGKDKERETESVILGWENFCNEKHIILLAPKAESDAGWVASDIDFISQTIRDVMLEYTVDSRRIVAHGLGNGGQMAYYLGFNARDLIRGVASASAPLTSKSKQNVSNQRLAFYIYAGGRDQLIETIRTTRAQLLERRFPVVYHEHPERGGGQYLDPAALVELVQWIDSLDRQ